MSEYKKHKSIRYEINTYPSPNKTATHANFIVNVNSINLDVRSMADVKKS